MERRMPKYQVTYESTTTPIVRTIDAPDPYTACSRVGRKTTTSVQRVLKVVEQPSPVVVFKHTPALNDGILPSPEDYSPDWVEAHGAMGEDD